VTGIEATGVALAILPLLVNQLDNYARGLEKMKAFRRYKWHLDDYSTGLSAQYAILLNTLELSLEDVVDDHDERSELINNPKGPGWSERGFCCKSMPRFKCAVGLSRSNCSRGGSQLCSFYPDGKRTVRPSRRSVSKTGGLETADYTTASYHSISTQAKELMYCVRVVHINKTAERPKVLQSLFRRNLPGSPR
jgi:hypothetical protein